MAAEQARRSALERREREDAAAVVPEEEVEQTIAQAADAVVEDQMKPGRWRDRFIFALNTSLHVLHPHRVALRALGPVLVGDPDDGVFAAGSAFSRQRVQQVFEETVTGASDAPKAPLAEALGRLLYLVHLAVLLWWLLGKSPKQRATAALIRLTEQLLPSAALTLRLPPVRRFVIRVDELIREALTGSPVQA